MLCLDVFNEITPPIKTFDDESSRLVMTKSSCQHGLVKSSTILLPIPEKPADSITSSQSNVTSGKGVSPVVALIQIHQMSVRAYSIVHRMDHTVCSISRLPHLA